MSDTTRAAEDFVRVGSVQEYEQGKLYNHKVREKYVAVVRNGEHFYAIINNCTHGGYLLTPGCITDGRIYCPAHGAYFRLEDGEPLEGPAGDPLDMCDIRIEGDDVLVAPPK